MKSRVPRTLGRGILWRVFALALLTSAFRLSPSALALSPRPPLYVSLIDRLPPSGDGALDGLDKAQRAMTFQAALRAAGNAGELPAVMVINDGQAVPPGVSRVRVYLKRWASTRPIGFTETDVLCRFDAEIVRDGRVVVRLGPYAGATNLDPTVLSTAGERRVVFQEAARRAIGEMASALRR